MPSKKTAATFFTLLPIAVLSLALTASNTESCHAQTFIGDGDGFSWHDPANWSPNSVPDENGLARIDRDGSLVQLNSPTSIGGVNIQSNAQQGVFGTASLTVNAQLSLMGVSCGGENGFFNMNANVNVNGIPGLGGSMGISDGATLNLNSGMLTARVLSFNQIFATDASATFNQNGGNFNVGQVTIQPTGTTMTIGPDDNVTDSLSLSGGDVNCERPLLLVRHVLLSNDATLTVNDDITATSFSIQRCVLDTDTPTLIWNQGDITAPRFNLRDGVVNRSGGRLMVDDFQFTRTHVTGMDHFTIREDDVISVNFNILGSDDFPVSATFEGPHNLQNIISQSQNSLVNYQQDAGETEGLAMNRYFNFGSSTLNLGFDSQSAGGLDWVLRVDNNKVEELEGMIDRGEIVVTGADFSVEYDAAAAVTYIQQTASPVVVGDVNLDGAVNFLDISPFIAVLSGGGFQDEADCDESGAVNFLDITPFIAILSGQ